MSASALRFERVTKRFRDAAGRARAVLHDVTLDVAPGEFVCLLGASGCGKTTLLNVVAGFERPDAGSVFAGDTEIAAPDPTRICMFQGYALFPWRTVLGNVEYGLEVRGAPRRERRRTALAFLALVGLEPFAHSLPHQLSGGMQQRAALARALAVDPGCLLMDEPFGALDAITRMRLQEEIARIAVEREKTVLFVTHDVEESVFLADRIVLMAPDPGRIHRVIEVPLARPRSRTSPVFVETRAEVLRELVALHAVDAA